MPFPTTHPALSRDVAPGDPLLLRDGTPVPLIPKYFDLLVLLIERRHEAVHRRDIFDRVWSDVVVSDSALSQAIRTIRRTLGDDSREPRFIRTVARHGYRFVFADVVEEDEVQVPCQGNDPADIVAAQEAMERIEGLLQRPGGGAGIEQHRRAAFADEPGVHLSVAAEGHVEVSVHVDPSGEEGQSASVDDVGAVAQVGQQLARPRGRHVSVPDLHPAGTVFRPRRG